MKLLVTGALGASPGDIAAIESLGHTVVLHPDERVPVADPESFEGIIGNSLFFYQGYEQFSGVRYLQITSAGYDRVPLAWVKEKGIRLFNAGGALSVPMAEWVIMRILELVKHVPAGFRHQLAGRYEKDRSWQELSGKQVLVVGFGAFGREIVKRLSVFGVHIRVVNRSIKEDPNVEAFYPLSELKALLPETDILILAVAGTADTYHLLDAESLSLLKPGSILINGARGSLIDEAALVRALQNGPLSGAALDVFEKEPLPADSPLWKLDNVLLSPHNSFVGEKNHERLMRVVLRNLTQNETPVCMK